MEHEVLVKDIIPYLMTWTGGIGAFLLALAYHLWRWEKQHSEAFRPDTTAEDIRWRHQKAKLRQQYHNKVRLIFAAVYIWMIGMILICNISASTRQGWLILTYAICALLLVLSLMRER